jgi:hypothetical protein
MSFLAKAAVMFFLGHVAFVAIATMLFEAGW